jgi:cytochrome b pre-mRNA-processing protein 3
MIFRQLFKAHASPAPVRRVYDAIVAQARQPVLYAGLAVPDTVSGRFDMIVLHVFLVLDRLRQGDVAAREFAQSLTDELFSDMDRSLREMGVGDLSVAKKMRRMAEVFHGRLKAYGGVRTAGADDLAAVLKRNVYAGDDAPGNAQRLAAYVAALSRALAATAVAELIAGRVDFGGAAHIIDGEAS